MQALNWDSNEKPLDLLLSFSIPLPLPAGISAYSFIDVHKLFQRLFWGGAKLFYWIITLEVSRFSRTTLKLTASH